MKKVKHKHQAIREHGPWGYTCSVNPWNENRAAHGNVGYTETCACGAERGYLVNGRHYEYGDWREGSAQRQERFAREMREQRLERARELAGRVVTISEGVRLDCRDVSAHELMEPSTVVRVVLDGPYQRRDRCHRIGLLRQAARDWADLPDSPQWQVYGGIVAVLPEVQS